MEKALIIVAQAGFQPIEYSDTRAELEKAGINVTVASIKSGEATGNDGRIIKVDKAITSANQEDYDAVVLIGGPGAARQLINNNDVFKLAQSFEKSKKIVAAICIAPVALANAGLLKGKNATVWNGDGEQDSILTHKGANYTGDDVTVDGKTITANGPMAAKQFGKTIAKILGGK